MFCCRVSVLFCAHVRACVGLLRARVRTGVHFSDLRGSQFACLLARVVQSIGLLVCYAIGLLVCWFVSLRFCLFVCLLMRLLNCCVCFCSFVVSVSV